MQLLFVHEFVFHKTCVISIAHMTSTTAPFLVDFKVHRVFFRHPYIILLYIPSQLVFTVRINNERVAQKKKHDLSQAKSKNDGIYVAHDMRLKIQHVSKCVSHHSLMMSYSILKLY